MRHLGAATQAGEIRDAPRPSGPIAFNGTSGGAKKENASSAAQASGRARVERRDGRARKMGRILVVWAAVITSGLRPVGF